MTTISHTESTSSNEQQRKSIVDYLKLRLMVNGYQSSTDDPAAQLQVPNDGLAHLRLRVTQPFGKHSPLEARVQAFLDSYLKRASSSDFVVIPGLGETCVLDRAGMALELSVPEHGDVFESDIVKSYRLENGQGVLHNPKADRRTTQGVFHVAEGGMPIPDDKIAVPASVFAKILAHALKPPRELKVLPFTSESSHPYETMVSLMLRPMVVPEVDGVLGEKRYEVQYVVPGNLVSNLDFIERIFGNGGDPYLPENDAAADPSTWSGSTGYVVLAPHLTKLTKLGLGLPNIANATERQKRDGMCWTTESEIYNGGNAFKLTCRDERGVVITVIADNYYGYCKKEIKTQISYSANLLGYVEEEHAGGAMVFPEYDLGKHFTVPTHVPDVEDYSFDHALDILGDSIDMCPGGFARDKKFSDIVYVPETITIDIYKQTASWPNDGKEFSLNLSPDEVYVTPSGFKVQLQQETGSEEWRLIGTNAEGTYCHKPSTVSGGGKSEISKPITDQIMYGPFFVADFEQDMNEVAKLLESDMYSKRRKDGVMIQDSRPLLSPERSMGSVIKLLTPSNTLYSKEYNDWLLSIPHAIRQLIYVIKRLYRPEVNADWKAGFSVDKVNGNPGRELRYNGEKLLTYYMRVGFTEDGSWRLFSLRNDFSPASKVQTEDDITVSAVIPSNKLSHLNSAYSGRKSYKIVSNENPEQRLFQRPDEAIHRGFDKLTEAHFATPGNFFSNFEPLTQEDAQAIAASPVTLSEFTAPMQEVVKSAAKTEGYFVSSAHPRLVDGKPSKNPRYLQVRPDIVDKRGTYLAGVGARLHRFLRPSDPLYTPVNAVLPGRRLNPPDHAAGIRPLAAYGPVHYQETPELFMEYISSLTGKSPSTTGAGSEGALTKGPFNALPPIIDLNNALVSHILTGEHCFATAAGYVGPNYQVDHDISLLIPEIWSRMEPYQREPEYLIKNGYLEKCDDFLVGNDIVMASRLGYRITSHFVSAFFGIVFDNPTDLFTSEMLKPEEQDMASFMDAIDNIVTTHKLVASNYFADGSINQACPPLKALLHIMHGDKYEGKDLSDPEIRGLFTLDALLKSDWYAKRLETQREADRRLWLRHITYLEILIRDNSNKRGDDLSQKMLSRLEYAQCQLKKIEDDSYTKDLEGFIGADPMILGN